MMKPFDDICNDSLSEEDDDNLESLITGFFREYERAQEFARIYTESKKIKESRDDFKKYLKVQLAQLKSFNENILNQLKQRKIVFNKSHPEESKNNSINLIKNTSKDIEVDENIKSIMKEIKQERDKLVNLLKQYNLISDKDLK